MNRRRYIPILCATALLGSGGSAMAQNGVTFDTPGKSPAQKEYAIPLNQARQDATGGDTSAPSTSPSTSASSSTSSGASGSSGSTPLFGEGIGDAAGNAAKQVASTNGAKKGGSGREASSVDSAFANARPFTAVSAKEGNGTLTIGAVTLAVLLLGGVLGSIASRRSRDA